jgi:hypothetical protein
VNRLPPPAAQGDATPVTAESDETVFALLEEHRANIAEQRVRAVNQLHAILRDLVPGGAKTALSANRRVRCLRWRRADRGFQRDRVVHRLSRSGDRRLNSAIHLVAVTQVRMRTSRGRRYHDTKIAEGKTHNEAMRCLKRRLASHLWRRMARDEQTRHRKLE